MDQAMMMNCAILALVSLTLIVGVFAWLDLRARDSRILTLLEGEQAPLPAQQPFSRSLAIESARRVYDAARDARLATEGDGASAGKPGKRDGADPVQLDLGPAWRPCSADGSRLDAEATPRSPVDYRSGMHPIVDALGEVVSPMAASVEVAAFREHPEAPPPSDDEEDTRAWERQSGTWTRGGP